MARTIRDAALDSRAARGRLTARGKPHYRVLEEGLHLGYRKARGRKGKPATAGKWVVRYYVQGQQSKARKHQPYAVETIATADDMSDANGLTVLTFAQAQTEARKRRDDRARTAACCAPAAPGHPAAEEGDELTPPDGISHLIFPRRVLRDEKDNITPRPDGLHPTSPQKGTHGCF